MTVQWLRGSQKDDGGKQQSRTQLLCVGSTVAAELSAHSNACALLHVCTCSMAVAEAPGCLLSTAPSAQCCPPLPLLLLPLPGHPQQGEDSHLVGELHCEQQDAG